MPSVQGSFGAARRHQFTALAVGRDAAPMAGNCLLPVTVELRGVKSILLSRLREFDENPSIDYANDNGVRWHKGGYKGPATTTGYIEVRCRKCANCLKARARMWAARAKAEVLAARRSWFGTLTLRPEERWRVRVEADNACHKRSVRWCDLNHDEQFSEMARVLRRDYQLFVKRVRKASAARVRYLMTTEAHADGFPHLHLLLHEYEGATTKRLLEQQWPHGISHWRLVDPTDTRAPYYVTKYLTKSILAKPIASLRYGQPPMNREALTEALQLLGTVTQTRGPKAPG